MDTFCHYCKRYCRFIYFLLGKSLLYSGNIVDWNTAGWTVENLHEFDLELETIKAESYLKSSYQLFISEKKKSFADSLKFCQDIGGEIGVAESNLAVTEMISAVQSKAAECDGSFWTGWTDQAEEGQFVSALTGERMDWDNWLPSNSISLSTID